MLTRDEILNRITTIMPFLQTVTYRSKRAMTGNSESGYDSYTIPRVRPRKATLADIKRAPADIALVQKVFELYAPVLAAVTGSGPALVPKKDDYLVDTADQSWRVLHVDSALNDGVFNCFVIENDT